MAQSGAYRAEVQAVGQSMRPAPADGEVGSAASADRGTEPKVSKDAVMYRDANKCECCRHYVASSVEDDSGTCHLVAGAIDGDAVCNLFDRNGAGPSGPTFYFGGPLRPR